MEDSQTNSNTFSVRIVSIDYYMAPPITDLDICYSSFQGGKVKEVPVIRIYGSTPAGQKTCLHIHRALPYLYIPCSELSLRPDQEGDACANALSLAIEKALKLKGNAGSKRQHVHGCNLVRAKKLYGYHSSEDLFVKIFLYHPQDVSRAANLLVGGVVLDKVLQPHESHIPFLLQFLIDYNLYGMGHLHVSKMKFRLPVPDIFSQRQARDNSNYRQQTDSTNCTTAAFPAGSSGNLCLGSPIWVASTIPDGWIWQQSSQHDSPIDGNVVTRQSTCQLEGDASVDEILNQQLLSYSSLSQAGTDTKMVQSLIPIWEEEFQRTGLHGAALLSEPGKPLPKDVLRTLSHGLEFLDKYMELYTDAGTKSGSKTMISQSMKSLMDVQNVDEFQSIASENNSREFSEEINEVGVQVSGSIGPSNFKTADKEVLMLLKWLASSQAVEDINSDDELVCNSILSPLLPETTMQKVLEKANMDYESLSQQECQDILDCVDIIDSEASKGKAIDVCQMSSNKLIPWVGGSFDDRLLIPCDIKSSEIEMNRESEMSLQKHTQHDFGSSVANKQKRKRSLQSYLSLSNKDVNADIEPTNSNLCGRSGNEHKHGSVTWFGEENETNICHNDVTGDPDKDLECSEEASAVFSFSVRDLMRRKRCYRVEPPVCEIPQIKVPLEEEWRKDLSIFTEKSDIIQEIKLPECKPSLFDQMEIAQQKNCEAKSELAEACDSKTDNPICLKYGKLPLVSCSGRPFPVRIPSDGNSSSERINDSVGTGSTVKSGNRFIDTISIDEQTKILQKPLHFENKISSVQMGCLENTSCADSDYVSNLVGPLIFDDSCKLDPCFKKLKFDDEDECLETKELVAQCAVSSSCLCISLTESNDKDEHISKNGYASTKPTESMELTTCTTPMRSDYPMGGKKFLYGSDNSISGIVNTEVNSKELIAMSFCKKPPSLQHADGISGIAPSSSATHSCPCPPEKKFETISVEDTILDECLPFFVPECLEGKEDFNHQKNGIMGVPTHFLNDGSYLYMLTPANSPPSVDGVNRWLQDNTEPLLESAALADEDTIIDKVNQKKQGSQNAEVQRLHDDSKILLESDGNVVLMKQDTGCSEDISQISGPDGKSKLTPLSQIGFRDPASIGCGQQLTVFSIEVQAESRGDSRSDPRVDAVNLIVLVIIEDDDVSFETYALLRSDIGHIQRNFDGICGCKVLVFSEEKHLFSHFIKIICSFDPDIIMGWDIQGGSLGFLAERAAHLGIGLLNKISRTPSQTSVLGIDSDVEGIMSDAHKESAVSEFSVVEDPIIDDEWGRTHASGVHVSGRIVLNVWRLVRSEVKLNLYSAEAVAEEVLRRKIPFIPCRVLTKWFASGPGRARYRCIEYVTERAKLNVQIMNQLDMINRTSELARVFGIDFFSVLSRGSQYRVESMLLRLAHTQNYLAIAPGSQQVASQPAMECLPLVMEPESGFYADPVVVLDFQSLYPSMIIAYNLCFCTCLGKVTPSKPNTLGVSTYTPDRNIMLDSKHEILLTPNGVMYVPSKVRRGVLPRLLEEILSTRIMVKKAMKKLVPSQRILTRIFNARQLALKLIANVTYGYTAAGFSGRMPCAELADSIVQCGRRTLETAISFVNEHEKWNAKVLYGDTDSMFVLLRGRSVKEALEIGQEIASTVTAMNPNPVTLKLEKVYHPCFLLTKKRYVGYSYESHDQVNPVFDAKGIETVRRDTCGAVSKTMEQSLILFFEHQDINKVKQYLLRQWKRILSGRISLQDFVFAKEVRLGTYSTRTSSLPPAAIVATKAMRADPRAEPRYAERIPYVVVHGEPGARLVDMVVNPLELLEIDSPLRLNDLYYINKQIIPALQRVFGLVGADLNQWFQDMSRPGQKAYGKRQLNDVHPYRTRIDYYYLSKNCILCGDLIQGSAYVCSKCSKNEGNVAIAMVGRTSKLEREIQHLAEICRHCGGGDWIIESGVKCTSLACSVFYERRKIQKELQSLSAVATEADLYPRCMVEWF